LTYLLKSFRNNQQEATMY